MRAFFFSMFLLGSVALHATARGEFVLDKHRVNQKIIQGIIKEYSIDEITIDLIGEIGKKALDRGFDVSAYKCPPKDLNNRLTYSSVPLWEGEDIPFVLYVYIWPSKEMAENSYGKKDGMNCLYGSPIHSHMFPCSFYILDGTLVQYLYEKVGGRVVKCVLKEVYPPDCFAIDRNDDQFIHRLVCKHPFKTPAFSMHMYNVGTDEEFQEIQELSEEEMVYQKVLKKDGSIQERPSPCAQLRRK